MGRRVWRGRWDHVGSTSYVLSVKVKQHYVKLVLLSVSLNSFLCCQLQWCIAIEGWAWREDHDKVANIFLLSCFHPPAALTDFRHDQIQPLFWLSTPGFLYPCIGTLSTFPQSKGEPATLREWGIDDIACLTDKRPGITRHIPLCTSKPQTLHASHPWLQSQNFLFYHHIPSVNLSQIL